MLFFFAIVSHVVHSTFCLVAKGDLELFILLPPHLTNMVLEIKPLDFVGAWQVLYQPSYIPAPNYMITNPTLKWLRSRHPKTLAILLRAASLGKPRNAIRAHIQWEESKAEDRTSRSLMSLSLIQSSAQIQEHLEEIGQRRELVRMSQNLQKHWCLMSYDI